MNDIRRLKLTDTEILGNPAILEALAELSTPECQEIERVYMLRFAGVALMRLAGNA